ncbi:MAG: hypothetical protein WCJ84_01210 [Candidatus Peregrinibacteria bacterium]
MKKILSLSVLLCFFSACSWWGNSESPEAKSVIPPEYQNSPIVLSCAEFYRQKCGGNAACEAQEEVICADKFLSSEAINTSNLALCESVPSDTEREICKNTVFTTLAVKANKKEDCSKISVPMAQKNCEMQVIIEQSKMAGNLLGCDQLSKNQKTKCINETVFSVISKTKDKKLCDSLEDKILKDSCIKQASVANSGS